jgi:hypothetical protein
MGDNAELSDNVAGILPSHKLHKSALNVDDVPQSTKPMQTMFSLFQHQTLATHKLGYGERVISARGAFFDAFGYQTRSMSRRGGLYVSDLTSSLFSSCEGRTKRVGVKYLFVYRVAAGHSNKSLYFNVALKRRHLKISI